MADLEGKTIVATYRSLLNVGTASNQELDGTPRLIEDGAGNDSALWLGSASVALGIDDTGSDFRVYSATTNEGLFYDASEDEFGLLRTTKLKFHDIGGGEEIFASGDGHLEINAGATIDMSSVAIDLNATGSVTIDAADDSNLTVAGSNKDLSIAVSGGSTQTLTISSAGTGADAIGINASAGGITVGLGGGAGDDFIVDSTTLVVESDNNRVGIGTATPSAPLHVLSGSDATTFLCQNSSTATAGVKLFHLSATSSSGGADGDLLCVETARTTGADEFNLFRCITASADVFNVRQNGFVGIGITSPTSPLHVYNEMADNGVLSHFEYHTSDNAVDANDTIMILEFGDDNSEAGTPYFMQFNDSDSIMAHIQWDNDNSAVFTDASDYRIKSNIEPMDGSLSNINKLKPSSFNIREASKKAYGFIAHELEEVYPSMVTGEKDAVDDDGKILPQSVAYSKLIPFMIKAIQELSTSNDALKARIEALEAA